MGQTLSFPATDKTTHTGGNERFHYAVTEMQGWRITMEDAHTVEMQLEGEDNKPETERNTFFAVYDGHGGGTVSKYAGQHVHKRLASEEAYREKNYGAALKRAFLGVDEDMLAGRLHPSDPSGSTAVAALVTGDNKIYCANAGDSRSVLSVKGEAKHLSYDHKPANQTEKDRIVAAGGYIEYGRVNGNLALARALGDFEFKKNYSLTPEKQIITSDPDIIEHEITEEDEFFVLACDGIWDCLTSQQVVDIIRLQVSEGKELNQISEFMCDLCMAPDTTSGAGIGCDNMTILIVAILHGRTKEQWYEWIKDRVKNKYGYETPDTVPQLYSPTRVASFRERKRYNDERVERDRSNDGSGGLINGPSPFGSFTRVLGSAGGISFHPGSGILSDSGTLMFDNDDSDDDSADDEFETDGGDSRSFFSTTFGGGNDVTKSLRAQLEELEDSSNGDALSDGEDDGSKTPFAEASNSNSGEESRVEDTRHPPVNGVNHTTQGEAPPPPQPAVNGVSKNSGGDEEAPEQLRSLPGGDEPSPAVKAEGLLDRSEDPIKA